MRITNTTGYSTDLLRRVIALAKPYCAQPRSMLARPKTHLTFCIPSAWMEDIGKDVAWPTVPNGPFGVAQEYSVYIELPPFLCPTISILRCLHWMGSRVWFPPPQILDYWSDIEAKVGTMLIAPTLKRQRQGHR